MQAHAYLCRLTGRPAGRCPYRLLTYSLLPVPYFLSLPVSYFIPLPSPYFSLLPSPYQNQGPAAPEPARRQQATATGSAGTPAPPKGGGACIYILREGHFLIDFRAGHRRGAQGEYSGNFAPRCPQYSMSRFHRYRSDRTRHRCPERPGRRHTVRPCRSRYGDTECDLWHVGNFFPH